MSRMVHGNGCTLSVAARAGGSVCAAEDQAEPHRLQSGQRCRRIFDTTVLQCLIQIGPVHLERKPVRALDGPAGLAQGPQEFHRSLDRPVAVFPIRPAVADNSEPGQVIIDVADNRT